MATALVIGNMIGSGVFLLPATAGACAPGVPPSHFAAGSMGPKVAAACQFVEATGTNAAIGALAEAMAIVHGGSGTTSSLRAEGVSRAAVPDEMQRARP